ncbi:hypothetical protein C8R44DRAFT_772084 [Mycena epipterygia]|nr:hypothetical protein C8R44DRAFT_772084 [Mycena epipterygia]
MRSRGRSQGRLRDGGCVVPRHGRRRARGRSVCTRRARGWTIHTRGRVCIFISGVEGGGGVGGWSPIPLLCIGRIRGRGVSLRRVVLREWVSLRRGVLPRPRRRERVSVVPARALRGVAGRDLRGADGDGDRGEGSDSGCARDAVLADACKAVGAEEEEEGDGDDDDDDAGRIGKAAVVNDDDDRGCVSVIRRSCQRAGRWWRERRGVWCVDSTVLVFLGIRASKSSHR